VNAALFVTVLLIAACGLVYELVAGALASYLLGDSVMQFSTVIGTYLFAMGVGSWLSRWVHKGVATRFVMVELMVAVVGGFSSTLLFLAFAWTDAFQLLLYVLVFIIGTLVGLEIPLLMRLLSGRLEFKDVVGNVLTFDYLGALGASLRGALVHAPAARRPSPPARAAGVVRGRAGPAFGRVRGGGAHHAHGRDQHVRGPRGAHAHLAVPAHRAHGVAQRPAPVPERPPAVQLA
jgi:predicted membrane-bound spermidine synthase